MHTFSVPSFSRKIIISILIVLLGLAGLPLNVQAAPLATNYTITTTVDDATNNGNCTLREAIIASNTNAVRDACPAGSNAVTDNITLSAGTYNLTVAAGGGDTTGTNGDLDIVNGAIATDITITGAGAGSTTIRANAAPAFTDRLFEVANNAGLQINNVTISNASNGNDGAAIRNAGTLTINTSTITNNTSTGGDGGAIFNAEDATLSISGSTVSSNAATTGDGGAIFSDEGGATLTITNTTFTSNTAGDDGGAIFSDEDGVITITGSTFSTNTSADDGGAIRNSGGSLSVSTSTFSNNTATGGDGGAISVDEGNGTITVTTVVFTSNRGNVGGAIQVQDTPVTITGSTFTSNSTNGGANQGGAIHSNGGNDALSITNTTFNTNSATRTITGAGTTQGGAIYNLGNPLTITTSYFNGNTVSTTNAGNTGVAQGGAIFNTGGNQTFTITLSSFVNNTISRASTGVVQGGAIFSDGKPLIVGNATFSGNGVSSSAAGANTVQGGGIYVQSGGPNTQITNVTLSGNTATGAGTVGGLNIFRATSTVTLTNTIVNGAGNSCGGTITNGGTNADSGNTCGFGAGNSNVTLNLGSLTGTIPYLPLGSGSFAIDRGTNGSCAAAPVNNTSQNGVTRPRDGDGNGTSTCDIGSYEFPGTIIVTITSDNPDPSVYGQTITVNFTVASTVGASGGAPTGSVTVSDGVNSCTGPIAQVGVTTTSSGSCTVALFTVGAGTLTATYSGDANFRTGTDTEPHTVNKANTTTNITSDLPDPSVYGQSVPVTIVVAPVAPGTGTPTGTVTISDGIDSCFATLSGGTGTCNIVFTTIGTRNLTATYPGDTNFNSSSDLIEAHVVDKANTTTTITSDLPDPSVYGQSVPVNFTVVANVPGSGTPTGLVTITDGVDSCSATVAVGTCTITFTTVGPRVLTATYPGDTNFNGSSDTENHQVDMANTTTTITSDLPDPSIYGSAVPITFTVVANVPGSGTPTGLVTITDGVDSCSATVAVGTCSITFTSVGPRTLTATYPGDTNFNGSSDTEDHQVDKATLTVTADNQTITYGDPDPAFTFTYSGFVLTDDSTVLDVEPTCTVVGAHINAATYPIICSGGSDDKYEFSYVDGLLTINSANLTITASNGTMVYGSTPPVITPIYSGLQNGDTQPATPPTCGTTATNTSPVGPYPSSCFGAIDTNYNIAYVDGTVDVTAKDLTITADDQTKVYGDAFVFAGTEFTTNGLVNSDTVTSVTLTSVGAPATATVGNYPIVASSAVGSGLTNYNITYTDGNLEVTVKDLTITADDQTKVYGDAFVFAGTEFTTNGLVNGDTVTSVTHTSVGAPATAVVGNYPIVASSAVGSGLTNYNITYIDGNLEVTVKDLTITADDQTKVYGDTFVFAGTEFTTNGLVNGDTVTSVTLTSAGAPATAVVGNYPIVASSAVGSGLTNYNITYMDGNLEVTVKDLTITADDQTKVYGDTFVFAGTEFTTNGLVNGDTVTSVTLTSAGAPATATVGNYPIVASSAVGSGLTNYNITYIDGNLEVTVKDLTITADDQTKVYGDTFVFAGTEFTTNGLVNGDTVTSVTLTSAGAPATATVGNYPIVANSAVGSGLTNYNITYIDGNLEVTIKTLTITADNQVKAYGDTFVFAGTEFTTNGLVNGDTVTSVTLSSAGAPATATVAGSPYDIVPSNAVGNGLSNYAINYVNGELGINTIALTITADDQTKVYGDTFVFVGTEFTTNGLINGDTVTSVTLTSAGAPATATVAGSPYDIVPSNPTGSGLGNYTISYVNGELSIDTKALTITADDQTKIYGDTFVFAGTEFTTNGLVNSDTVTNVTLTSAGAPAIATVAGSLYDIVPSNAVGNGLGNYTISYVNGAMDVTLRPLTITSDDQTKVYGDTFTFAGTEFSTSGLANTDTVDSVTLTSAGAPATATVAGSPYSIVPSNAVGSGLDNYSITYANGNLFVNLKPLTITATDQFKTYGDTFVFVGTEFTTNGLVNGDTVTSVTLTSAGTPAIATIAGSPYAIVPSLPVGSGLSNYSISYVNGSLFVNLYTLTITADPQTKTYGDSDPVFTYQITTGSLQNGDTLSGLLSRVAGENVGSYAITQGSLTAGPNYSIDFISADLTIIQRNVTVEPDAGQTKTYGDPDPTLTYQIANGTLAFSDSFSGVLDRAVGEDVGTYLINQGTLTLGPNYNLTFTSGPTFEITKRPIAVQADAQTKTYGDPDPTLTYQITSGSLAFSDAFSGALTRDPGETIGSYPIRQGSLLLTTNYDFTFTGADLVIGQRPIEVTADAQNKIYGDPDPALTYQITSGSLAFSDAFSGALTRDLGETVASYPIRQGSLALNGNYALTFIDSALTIGQRVVVVTADAKSKTFGSADPALTYQITTGSLASGDAFAGDITRDPGETVNTYAISQGTLTLPSDYDFTFVNGIFTINPVTLDVKADNQSINYGDPDPLAFTFTYTGFVNSEDQSVLATEPTCSVSGAHTQAGGYPIICSGGVDENYAFNYIDGTLTVEKLILTVTADDQLISVGDPDPVVFTFSYSGFLSGEDASALTTEPVCSVSVQHTNPGLYPIVCSGGAADNYEFNYVDGNLTVNGAPIVVDVKTNQGLLSNFQVIASDVTRLLVKFNEDVYDGNIFQDSVSNPANYLLVRDNANDGIQTTSCLDGVVEPSDIAISVDNVEYDNGDGSGPFVATLTINSDLPLSNGTYRLLVCGTTSIADILDPNLSLAGDGVNSGTDYLINFLVTIPSGNTPGGNDSPKVTASTSAFSGFFIPVTGFTPDQKTQLPTQLETEQYFAADDLKIEIPSLSVQLPVVGIPLNKTGWNVKWLGNRAGYLDGSAYPTWSGNTVLTGHVTDANGNPGPFAYIKELRDGDKIIIHSNGQKYIYEIRSTFIVSERNVNEVFKHEEYQWLTLVTCENYDLEKGRFVSRRVVRAVLISVIDE